MSISYHILESIDELEKVIDLEIEVWGLQPREAAPSSLLHAMISNGSLVVGAFDADKLIGMAFMFPTSRNRPKLLWSHMAAVHPDYQSQGIGFDLKQFQRSWALEHDYQAIAWTYDPLQRGNANFNLHTLGATTSVYHVNFYGEMADGLNAGLPSDRLEVIWSLSNQRVKSLSKHKQSPTLFSLIDIPDENLLLQSKDGYPVTRQIASNQLFYLAEIPKNINKVKQEERALALAWRIELRKVLQNTFQLGYIAQDFISIEDRHYYVLVTPRAWYMYVLECSDQTLYTGITPDIKKRIFLHNSGHGAAYTKARRPVTPLAAWQFTTRQDAMKAEYAFKALTRQKKLSHIQGKLGFRDAAFVDIDG